MVEDPKLLNFILCCCFGGEGVLQVFEWLTLMEHCENRGAVNIRSVLFEFGVSCVIYKCSVCGCGYVVKNFLLSSFNLWHMQFFKLQVFAGVRFLFS